MNNENVQEPCKKKSLNVFKQTIFTLENLSYEQLNNDRFQLIRTKIEPILENLSKNPDSPGLIKVINMLSYFGDNTHIAKIIDDLIPHINEGEKVFSTLKFLDYEVSYRCCLLTKTFDINTIKEIIFVNESVAYAIINDIGIIIFHRHDSSSVLVVSLIEIDCQTVYYDSLAYPVKLENFHCIIDNIEISWVTPWLKGMDICDKYYDDSEEDADFCDKFERRKDVSGSSLQVANEIREMYKKSLIEIKVTDYYTEYDRDYFKDNNEAYYRYKEKTRISTDPFS